VARKINWFCVPAKVYITNLSKHMSDLFQAGDIHIWDRVSAVLLRHIRAQDVGGDLTCLAWNPAAENPFMFAAGSHDGAVRIWSSPVPTTSIQNEGGSSQPHTESHTQPHARPHADPYADPFTQAGTMHDTQNHAMEASSHSHSDVEYRSFREPGTVGIGFATYLFRFRQRVITRTDSCICGSLGFRFLSSTS
jgi:WD40 repeat protein